MACLNGGTCSSNVLISLGGYGSFGNYEPKNTIARSVDNGATWTGLGYSMFSFVGNGAASTKNGDMIVAVGSGGNSIAYSTDTGLTWTGLGSSIFGQGIGIAYNGKMWVAAGQGSNTLAYSYDGINWKGLGNSIIDVNAMGVAWNGTMWVAVGYYNNGIAYSYDGINWTGLGNSGLYYGNNVAWGGNMWVAVGASNGATCLYYSPNGIDWTAGNGLGRNTIWAGVAWNGTQWVTVGAPNSSTFPSIAYSSDGMNWTMLPSNVVDGFVGYDVTWTGSRWIAAGQTPGPLIIASNDGINWTSVNKTIYSTYCHKILKISDTCSSPNTCTCVNGWSGAQCQTPPCAPPCQNGGMCSGPNTCTCATGWSGAQCQTPVCDVTHECVNGGVCSSPNKCSGCNPGWTGDQCQTSQCAASPCQNGGCIGVNTCTCATGWAGAQCQTAVCDAGYACGVNGRCSSPNTCTCLTGWTGAQCQTPVCDAAHACVNGGVCSSPNKCSGCNPGWTGDQCQTSQCVASPCQNKGTCSGVNTCTCATGWAGAQCQNPTCDPRLKSIVMKNNQGVNIVPERVEWYNPDSAVAKAFGKEIPDTIFNPSLIPAGYECDWLPTGANPECYTFDAASWNGTATAPTFKVSLGGPTEIDGTHVTAYATENLTQKFKVKLNYLKDNQLAEYIYSSSGPVSTVFASVTMQSGVILLSLGSAGGSGFENSLAYSTDNGTTWTGMGNQVFSAAAEFAILYNGLLIAVGSGLNSMAYSTDGLNWNGLGTSIFDYGQHIARNGSMFIAVGGGSNTIAYSYNGTAWVGLGASIFDNGGSGNGVASNSNGSVWVAVGGGSSSTHGMGYSSNGKQWNGLGLYVLRIGRKVACNNSRFVAVGDGTYSGKHMYYSDDGQNWNVPTWSGTASTAMWYDVGWNGSQWGAVGQGSVGVANIAYSSDGSVWTGVVISDFTGSNVSWVGSRWIATGVYRSNTNTKRMLESSDGIAWTDVTGARLPPNTYVGNIISINSISLFNV